jgi:error-prone DNA polymerase
MEDETGTASIMVWKKVYEAFREAVIAELLVGIISRIERNGPVVHVIAACVEYVSHVLAKQGRPVNINANDGRANEVKRLIGGSVRSSARNPREQAGTLFRSRDFH